MATKKVNISEIENDDLILALHMQEFFNVFYLNLGLQPLIDKAREIFGHPMVIHDTCFRLLAYSFDANTIIRFTEDERGNKYVNEDTIQYISENNVAQKLRRKGASNYFEKSQPSHGTLVSIIKIDGIEVAQLAIYESGIPFQAIDFKLIDRFSQLLSVELQKDNSSSISKNFLHDYVLLDLLEGKVMSENSIRNKLHYLKWVQSKEIKIMVISNIESKSLDSKIPFVIQALKLFVPSSNCIVYQSDIVIFVENESHDKLFCNKNTEFIEFLKANQLSAGGSLNFSQISVCKKYFAQAIKALEVCRRQKQNLLLFEECKFQIISDFIVSQYDLEEFCHPAVLKLLDYDKENGTELLKTLENYIYYTNSPNEAAKVLSIHRNTLFYRINKIKDIADISLNNASEIMQIYLAIMLLEINKIDF